MIFKATLNCSITFTDGNGKRRYIPSNTTVTIRYIPKGQAYSNIHGFVSLTEDDSYVLFYENIAMDVFPDEFTKQIIHT